MPFFEKLETRKSFTHDPATSYEMCDAIVRNKLSTIFALSQKSDINTSLWAFDNMSPVRFAVLKGSSASTRLLRALGAEDPFIEGAFALKYEPIANRERELELLEEALNFDSGVEIEQPVSVSQLLSTYTKKEKISSILTLRMVGTRSDLAYEDTPSADAVLQAKKDKLNAEKAGFAELRRAYDFPFGLKPVLGA